MRRLLVVLVISSACEFKSARPARPATRDCNEYSKRGFAQMDWQIAGAYQRCMEEKLIDMRAMELEAKQTPLVDKMIDAQATAAADDGAET